MGVAGVFLVGGVVCSGIGSIGWKLPLGVCPNLISNGDLDVMLGV